ncbi:MAG: RNA-directed DNA polymerase [Thiohalospira sp.]
MKTILNLSDTEARDFLLKPESYCNFELPEYISFKSLIDQFSKELTGKKLKECRSSSPRNKDDVNLVLLNNKDGKYAWRPFQLIHPALYVSLVHSITQEEGWTKIKERFEKFSENENIECHSLPVISEDDKSDKQSQIYEWWQKIEQHSLVLAIEYNHLLHLDITDCYGSLYTHSITWAIHTKKEAKKPSNRNNADLIGVSIDNHIQDMSNGQTNGIPQGSVLMDFLAEIVLGYGDLLLTKRLNSLGINDYKILRYRDDYRIFSNSPQQSAVIAKELSEVLSSLNFKINASKTISEEDLILGALKPDKIYWINNKRKTENIQKWLIQLYTLGKEYPNSGTLFKETKLFLDWLQKKVSSDDDYEIKSADVLISIIVNLAYYNPRLYPLVSASISFIISQISDSDYQKEIIEKIKNKFKQLPNTSYLEVWLQRLTLKIDSDINYESKLCQKVKNNAIQLWNSSWLNPKYKKIIEDAEIIDKNKIEKIEITFSKEETDHLGMYSYLYS